MSAKNEVDRVLRQTFGHSSFRAGQRDLIDSVLAGRDVVAVMLTGSGKSLCFQLPAVLLEGTTVVVSPLIALMKDQLDGLREQGIAAGAIHSGLPAAERYSAQADLAAGPLRMVYIAPERLSNRAFRDALARARVARLVIDEALACARPLPVWTDTGDRRHQRFWHGCGQSRYTLRRSCRPSR